VTVVASRPVATGIEQPSEPPRDAPVRPRPPWLTPVTVGLMIAALLAAWVALYLGPLGGLQEARDQSIGYGTFREELASGVNPPPPFAPGTTLRAGDPVAVLNVPAIGLKNTVVFEGTTSADLERGPGHLPGTVLPGESGISTLLGRAVAFGGPFGALTKLRSGDAITVTTGQGTYHYSVVDVRGPGQPIPSALASAPSRLMLITAANNGWRNLWVPTHAIYVDAVIQGKAGAIAQVTTAASADLPMHSDTSGLFQLVLWLQLLFLASFALAWSSMRWGRWQLWIVGVPAVVAVLWGVSGQFAALLPNLL
jgi:sortase A